MASSITGLKTSQLVEIKKWLAAGRNQTQVAQTMGLTRSKVVAAAKYLRDNPNFRG